MGYLLVKISFYSLVRFDTIPSCDGRTDRRTDGHSDDSNNGMAATPVCIHIIRHLVFYSRGRYYISCV